MFSSLLLGIFSVLFVSFVPGFLIERYLLKDEKVNIPLIFGLSLLSVFLIVFLLSLFGIYTKVISWILVLGTLIGLIYFLITKREKIYFDFNNKDWWIVLLFFVLSWLRIGFSYFYPFIVGDAWASWNRWAVEWWRLSQFSFVNDFTYPQLLPTTLSFIYTLFDGIYTSEYFSHGLTIFFSLFILLVLARFRSSLSKFSIVLFSLYFLANQSSFFSVAIGDGLADIPVAFFIILSLWLWQEYNDNKDRRYLYLAFIMAGAATLTKQAGLFYWLVLPVMIIFHNYKIYSDKFFKTIKNIFYPWITSLLLVLSWYGVQHFSQAATFSQIQDALEGRSIIDRILTSIYIIVQSFGIYLSTTEQSTLLISVIVLVFGTLVLFGLWQALKKSFFYNVLFWFYVLPYGILWALVYSYDTRNALVVLILGFFIVFDGWTAYLMKYKNKFDFNNWFKIGVFFVLFISVFLQRPLYAHIANPFNINSFLQPFWLKVGEVSIGDRELVKVYFEERNRDMKLLTNNYPFVVKLHLEDRSKVVGKPFYNSSIIDSKAFLGALEGVDLVLWQGALEEVNLLTKSIENVLGKNRVKLLYNNGEKGVYLYKIES